MKKSLILLCLALLLLLASVAAFSNNRADDPAGVGVAVSPQTLILNSDQGTVSVHTDIPYSQVDIASLKLNGIAASGTKADATGCLVAFFPEDAVKAIVSPPSATLTLTGRYVDGGEFSGADTVQVIYRNR